MLHLALIPKNVGQLGMENIVVRHPFQGSMQLPNSLSQIALLRQQFREVFVQIKILWVPRERSPIGGRRFLNACHIELFFQLIQLPAQAF